MKTRTENIAAACFPLFEPFIELALQQAAASLAGLRAVSSGVHEVGPMFGHGGVCLEARQLPLDDVTLGAGFFVIGPKADSVPVLRLTVGWFRAWACDCQAGFSVVEFEASCRPETPEDARSWVNQVLPGLRRAMSTAIKRGRPPFRARHWLQRVLGRVPPAQIMTLASGYVNRFPDLGSFKQTYDLPQHPA